MTEKQTEALQKLNQGIQESRRTVQQQTMELAQDYFVNSAEALKEQIKESRATLEGLPDQIPGGGQTRRGCAANPDVRVLRGQLQQHRTVLVIVGHLGDCRRPDRRIRVLPPGLGFETIEKGHEKR